MREDVLKYQEQLEKGYINRLEKKEKISKQVSQKKRYELESWVSAENKKLDEKKKVKKSDGLNAYKLQKEREEAASIISKMNRKAKQIKG